MQITGQNTYMSCLLASCSYQMLSLVNEHINKLNKYISNHSDAEEREGNSHKKSRDYGLQHPHIPQGPQSHLSMKTFKKT